jgi:tetratricopeptide (TPR) repeat protein
MLFPLLSATAVPAPAQTAKPAAPSRQQGADEAARKQLAAYMADFQNNPDNATLRNEIVALAKTLKPAPAIPQPAQDDFAKAAAQMKAASSADDFKAAARLFEQVAAQAPWYADADYNAAYAYVQAADYDSAKRNLALYLAAVRPGVDTKNAEELGRDLDLKESTQQFQQVLQQFSANPSDAARQQIIKQVQAMKTPPEIPEEARGHYVMGLVLVKESENDGNYERAIEQFKAASLAAPWWGDAYKKLADAQKAAGQYDDAIASLNLYQLTQPSEVRSSQDEIYRLKALAQVDNDAKKQKQQEQQKLQQEQQQKELAAIEGMKLTVEGRWYQVPMPGGYFVGGESSPNCDYSISQNRGQWAIKNSCPRPGWAIDNIDVHGRQISFRLSGHDSGYPFAAVAVNFTLSADGKSLDGIEAIYNNGTEHIGDHAVRWIRRE